MTLDAARDRAPSQSAFLAAPMEYALARKADAVWTDAAIAGLQQRDLAMAAASGGQIGGVLLRAASTATAARWSDAGPRFRFAYVTAGSVSFDLGGERTTLQAGDAAMTETLLLAENVQWSAGFEAIEFVAPAADGVRPAPLLDIAPTLSVAAAKTGIARDRPDAYEVGVGPRRFLEYRDLGTIAPTGRRIHVHQVRAVDTPEGGTGWHVHSMSQLFYVFRGWVDISVEGQGAIRMVAGDAMCIGADMRHNVSKFSADYDLIEICLPADYSTVPTPAPPNL